MVQTFSAKMLTSILSAKTGLNTEIQTLKVDFFSGIEIRGLLMDDHKGNPMIKVNSLRAKPVYADWGLFGLLFKEIEMDGAAFIYGRYKGEEDFNFTYLLNSFSDTAQSEVGNFKLKSRKLKLTASMFHLFDENNFVSTYFQYATKAL